MAKNMTNSFIQGSCKTFASSRLGAKGMKLKEIDEFIKEKIPKEMLSQYRRSKKDRESLCKLLATFKEGRTLLRASKFAKGERVKNVNTPPSPEKKKTTPPKKKEKAPSKKNNGNNFQLTNENGEVANNNNNKERQNYNNNGSSPDYEKIAKAEKSTNARRLKMAEPDPFKQGTKLTGRTKAQMKRKLRRLQVSEGRSMADLIKEQMTMRPKNMKARATAMKGSSKPTKGKAPTFINFGKSMSEATGRKPTKSKPVIGRQRYSPSQIRQARRKADTKYSQLNRAGLVPSSNQEIKNLKKELLNSYLANMPLPNRTKPKESFLNITTYENVYEKLEKLKKMERKDMSSSQKRFQRILEKLEKPKRIQRNKNGQLIKIQRPVKMVAGVGMEGTPNSASPVEDMKNRAIAANNLSRENLEEKVRKGEASKKEKTMLNVMKALESRREGGRKKM